MEEDDEQVLSVALIRILGVGGDVQLLSLADKDVFIVGSVSRANLRSFLNIQPCQSEVLPILLRMRMFGDRWNRLSHGVEGNGKGTALELALGLAGMVDYGLMVL